jgi:hypothetical protein
LRRWLLRRNDGEARDRDHSERGETTTMIHG